jgi:hypothetical protein
MNANAFIRVLPEIKRDSQAKKNFHPAEPRFATRKIAPPGNSRLAVWRGPISFLGDPESRGCFAGEGWSTAAAHWEILVAWLNNIKFSVQRRRRWQRRRGASSHKHAASGSTDRSIDWHLRCLSSRARVCVSDNKPNFILPRGGRLQWTTQCRLSGVSHHGMHPPALSLHQFNGLELSFNHLSRLYLDLGKA